MKRISNAYLDELNQRIDLVELIGQYVPLKRSGRNHWGCCPFHEEKTPSFSVSSDKGFYHCFGCGEHGNGISFLTKVQGLSFQEAVTNLAQRYGLPLPEIEKRHDEVANRQFKLLQELSDYYVDNLRKTDTKQLIEYLKKRGVLTDSIEKFRLGFAPEGWQGVVDAFSNQKDVLLDLGLIVKKDNRVYDRFRNRLMFPIINQQNTQTFGFGGRVLDDGVPKYMNSPESHVFKKSQLLYGVHALNLQHSDCVVLTEGYMDVLMLHQHGFYQAMAALGTAIGVNHIEKLSRFSNRVVFCFDADSAGFKAVLRTLKLLFSLSWDASKTYEFLLLPKGEDPDSLVRKKGLSGWHAALKTRRTWMDIFLSYVSNKGKFLEFTEGKLETIARARSLLDEKPSESYMNLIVQVLSDELNWQPEVVRRYLLNQTTGAPLSNHSSKTMSSVRKILSLEERLLCLLLCHPSLFFNAKNSCDYRALSSMRLLDLMRCIQAFKSTDDLIKQLQANPTYITLRKQYQRQCDVYKKMSQNDAALEWQGVFQALKKQHDKKHLNSSRQKALEATLNKK